jgi:ABC-2 type transport system permease protein
MGFLIRFFIRNGIHSKRTIWMAVLGLLPVGCGLLLLILKPFLQREGITLLQVFPQIAFSLYLHFLLPLMALLIGSAVIADEVEDRTLTYLLVRPIPRHIIVLSKLLAGWITTGLILLVSVSLTYSVMMLGSSSDAWVSNLPKLLKSVVVLLLGLAIYMPFFGLAGGILKRPVLFGIVFSFGWENLYLIPGNAKILTMSHYLHVFFPYKQPQQSGLGLLSFFMKQASIFKQTSPLTALLVLLVLGLVFTLSMAMLLYIREYRLSEN